MDTQNTNRPLLPAPLLEATLEMWGQAGRQHFIPITGHSMLPFIQDGDRVLVAHGCTGVRRGDVVVLRRGDRLIAHRVLCIHHRPSEPIFITKGDHIRQFDSPASANEIVGRVLAIERGGRQMPLNTAAWRVVGWLIAVSTLAWINLYGWGRGLKRRLWGPQPSRLAVFLRRSVRAFSSLALRVVQALLCR